MWFNTVLFVSLFVLCFAFNEKKKKKCLIAIENMAAFILEQHKFIVNKLHIFTVNRMYDDNVQMSLTPI